MTYSMILNLLRVKGMSVEDIMSHSFKELHSRRKLKNYRRELNELQKEEPVDVKNKLIYQKLEQFYEACAQFIESWNTFSVGIFSNLQIDNFHSKSSDVHDTLESYQISAQILTSISRCL